MDRLQLMTDVRNTMTRDVGRIKRTEDVHGRDNPVRSREDDHVEAPHTKRLRGLDTYTRPAARDEPGLPPRSAGTTDQPSTLAPTNRSVPNRRTPPERPPASFKAPSSTDV